MVCRRLPPYPIVCDIEGPWTAFWWSISAFEDAFLGWYICLISPNITSCNSTAFSLTIITLLNSEWNFGVQKLPYPLTLLKVSECWRRKRFYVPSVVHKFKSVRSSFDNFCPFAFIEPWSYWVSHGCEWSRLSPAKILRALPYIVVLRWGCNERKTCSSEARWRPCGFYWKRSLSSVIILPFNFACSPFSRRLMVAGELFMNLHPQGILILEAR